MVIPSCVARFRSCDAYQNSEVLHKMIFVDIYVIMLLLLSPTFLLFLYHTSIELQLSVSDGRDGNKVCQHIFSHLMA